MCFSAEASFIGAGALTVIGGATLKLPLNRRDYFWACLPLLFGFQQFCEGVVWLDLRGTIPHSPLTVLAKDLYLFFALVLWLLWFPLAFLMAEPNPLRKNFMQGILAGGMVIACTNLTSYSILELTPTIKGHSIHYLEEAPLFKRLCYLAVIALPPLFSSLKHMKIFGVLSIISCMVAEYFYTATFSSVWCFLGAFTSAVLYLIAKANVSGLDDETQQINS